MAEYHEACGECVLHGECLFQGDNDVESCTDVSEHDLENE